MHGEPREKYFVKEGLPTLDRLKELLGHPTSCISFKIPGKEEVMFRVQGLLMVKEGIWRVALATSDDDISLVGTFNFNNGIAKFREINRRLVLKAYPLA